jgi:hypothetical protein
MAVQTKLKSDKLEHELKKAHGNLATVARAFGVSRTAVFQFIGRRPKLQEVLNECREVQIDMVESALYAQALKGNMQAVMFFLRTQARSRGYIEKQEFDLDDMLDSMGPIGAAIRRSLDEQTSSASAPAPNHAPQPTNGQVPRPGGVCPPSPDDQADPDH